MIAYLLACAGVALLTCTVFYIALMTVTWLFDKIENFIKRNGEVTVIENDVLKEAIDEALKKHPSGEKMSLEKFKERFNKPGVTLVNMEEGKQIEKDDLEILHADELDEEVQEMFEESGPILQFG